MNKNLDVIAIIEGFASSALTSRDRINAERARAAIIELIEAASDICYEVSDRSDGKRLLIEAIDRLKGGAE